AAEDVIVNYESLPVVVDLEEALKDETVIHDQFGTNRCYEWSLGGGDVDAGLSEADVVVERRIVNHRTAGGAIEPRAALAEWRGDELTLWTTNQAPHLIRLLLAGVVGVPEDRL